MNNDKTYIIETLLDFVKVPEDRREACLKMFMVWIKMADDLGNDSAVSMIWEDDGDDAVTSRAATAEEAARHGARQEALK